MVIGTKLGPYEIVAPLGAGGMGEVYRATDTRLKRAVAIKVLPESVAGDVDRLARFQREAEVLAALNHPNIAHIHGLETIAPSSESGQAGLSALVMELVEGDDLSVIIARGPIPPADALPIARQIADALEAAHDRGIIHRDLKPANVKVRDDGVVKVLDFGLAKAVDPVSSSGVEATNSPTMIRLREGYGETGRKPGTEAGLILGTAAYMAPEQAKGKAVDKRADVWAFGVVLYEMLTGRRLFDPSRSSGSPRASSRGDAEDISETLAAVLRQEITLSALPATTPPRLTRLIGRCLERDPKQRLRDIGEARIELVLLETGSVDTTDATAATSAESARLAARRQRALAWTTAAALLVAAVLATPAIRHLREVPPASPAEMRTEIVTPATADPASFALSPDGRQIVFVGSGDGISRLWQRSLASTTAKPLEGTEGATAPFWSPDSRSVGFFADGKLKRTDPGGGAPLALATAVPRAGTWNADDVILFSSASPSPLFRVSAKGSGGRPVAVTKLDRQTSHRCPFFLPDGRQFLFLAQGTPDAAGIYLGTLDSPDTHRLTSADTAGVYLPSGWLLWVRAGKLVAQRLDLKRKGLTGDPLTLADPVVVDLAIGAGAVSVSATGLVAYRTGGGGRRQLAWFDRSGNSLGNMGPPDEYNLGSPTVSRDGRRVAVFRTEDGNTDIFLRDAVRTPRFTVDPAADAQPFWSHDDSLVLFDSNRKGHRDLYLKASSGGGTEDLLYQSAQDKTATDWSVDGRFVMYQSSDPQTNWDLWVLPMGGDRKPTPWVFLRTGSSERMGQISPDGRFVAYMSNESGSPEIRIRPFADPTAPGAAATSASAQWTVSTTGGGIFPRWGRDSTVLYYLGPTGAMMAAPITATGTTLTPGAPVALFDTRIYGGGVDNGQGRQYDVTRDGRFLINTVLDAASAPITLLQNWSPAAKK